MKTKIDGQLETELTGWMRLVFSDVGARLLPQYCECPTFSAVGADRVGGQLRGDKEWRNQFWQSLEEGAAKQCSECGLTEAAVVTSA